jgi:histone-lysine N-methyltransferase SETMAR
MGASLRNQIKACFNAMETSQFTSSLNKKFRATPSAGKLMLTVFWDLQGVLLAHFQNSGEHANFPSYCEVLLKLRHAIQRKLPGQLARGVLLHHVNARPHTARANQERIQELQWGLPEHPPCSPDLASSDFHLLKHNLSGKRFADDEEVETEAQKWLRQQSKDFCAAGFDALVKRLDKCINVCGGYVEK